MQDRLRGLVGGAAGEGAAWWWCCSYQEDLLPAEIAELLSMPVSTVKSHLHRSLALLRGRLEKRGIVPQIRKGGEVYELEY